MPNLDSRQSRPHRGKRDWDTVVVFQSREQERASYSREHQKGSIEELKR